MSELVCQLEARNALGTCKDKNCSKCSWYVEASVIANLPHPKRKEVYLYGKHNN